MTTSFSEDWNKRFVRQAYEAASWSKDPKRKVGAFIVQTCRTKMAWGYNGFPRGVEDSLERLHNDELRLRLTVHAELNAILNASFDLAGSTLYVTQPPCQECAKAIIQKGIKDVFCPPLRESKWLASWRMAELLLTECGIRRHFIHYHEEYKTWDD